MKKALVVTCFNRADYVARCFKTLEAADLSGVLVVVVDDGSFETLPMLGIDHQLIRHTQNAGVNAALVTGLDYAMDQGAEWLMVLDSDAVVAPDFYERIFAIRDRAEVVTGFHKGIARQEYCNGINMLFSAQFYGARVRPILHGSASDWDMAATRGVISEATVPGCVQHIGYRSSLGHDIGIPDVSSDFKEIKIPGVRLVAKPSLHEHRIKKAEAICRMNIEFDPGDNPTHELIFSIEGWVTKPEAWDPQWLEADHLGCENFALRRIGYEGPPKADPAFCQVAGKYAGAFAIGSKAVDMSGQPRFLHYAEPPKVFNKHIHGKQWKR